MNFLVSHTYPASKAIGRSIVLLSMLVFVGCRRVPVKQYMCLDDELRMAFIGFASETNANARLEDARLIENIVAKRIREQDVKIPIHEVFTLLGAPDWKNESGNLCFYVIVPGQDFPLLHFIGLNQSYINMCLIQEDYSHDD